MSNPTITSITPDSGANTGTVHITDLAGTDFMEGAIVGLVDFETFRSIIATNVVVVSSTQITCDFDLTGVNPDVWPVGVANTDEGVAYLEAGFEVTGEWAPSNTAAINDKVSVVATDVYTPLPPIPYVPSRLALGSVTLTDYITDVLVSPEPTMVKNLCLNGGLFLQTVGTAGDIANVTLLATDQEAEVIDSLVAASARLTVEWDDRYVTGYVREVPDWTEVSYRLYEATIQILISNAGSL